MNETEAQAELMAPAIRGAGWGMVDGGRVRQKVVVPGRIKGAGAGVALDRFAAILDEPSTSTQPLRGIHEQKLTLLVEFKQSILHKICTGELTAAPSACDRTLSGAGL